MKRKILSLLAVFVFALTAFACGEKTELTVSTDSLSVYVGGTASITASVSDESAITYASGDTAIATVSTAGVVTGVAVGTTTITVTAGKETASVSVTVTEYVALEATAPETTLIADETALITVSGLGGETASYSSSAPNVVSVAANGTVSAVGEGSATITVTTATRSTTIDFTVRPAFYHDASEKLIEIYSPSALVLFNSYVNSPVSAQNYQGYTIKIKRDLDMQGDDWEPLNGYQFSEAVFDGEGHTISDLSITRSVTGTNTWGTNIPTIGFIYGTYRLTMKDITFDSLEVSTNIKYYCGIIIGYMDGVGEFTNVTVQNSSIISEDTTAAEGSSDRGSGRGTGAFIGYVNDSYKAADSGRVEAALTFTNCTVSGVTVTSNRSAGFVGRINAKAVFNTTDENNETWHVTIENCTVKDSTFRAFTGDANGAVHFFANFPGSSIGAGADSAVTVSNTHYFVGATEYSYLEGVMTAIGT